MSSHKLEDIRIHGVGFIGPGGLKRRVSWFGVQRFGVWAL